MKLVILGGPGSGRGTQANLLCGQLGIPWISAGEMLRQAIAAQTDLGKQAQSWVAAGELVPDMVMIELTRQRLTQPDAAKGWLLDGYPRTAFQAEELDFLLDELGQHLDKTILLEVPDGVMMQRSLARGQVNDQPEIVDRRIASFHEYTNPMLEYYEFRQRLIRINGNQSREQVHQELVEQLAIQS